MADRNQLFLTATFSIFYLSIYNYIRIKTFSKLWIMPEVPNMRSNHTRARNIINKTFSNQACSEPVRLAIDIPFGTEQR